MTLEATQDVLIRKAGNAGSSPKVIDYLFIQKIMPEPAPEPKDFVDFSEMEGEKSTEENPEAGVISKPVALSGGSQVESADEQSGLSLWQTEEGAELRLAQGKSFYVLPPAGEKALKEIIIKGKKLSLKASNGEVSDEAPAEEPQETQPTEETQQPQEAQQPEEGQQPAGARRMADDEPATEPADDEPADEPAADEEETIYWTGNINKVSSPPKAMSASRASRW